MEKAIFNVLQLIVFIRVGYTMLRWVFSPKVRRKSIVGKVLKLISRQIHYKLDNALKKQTKAFQVQREVANGKVIPLRNTK